MKESDHLSVGLDEDLDPSGEWSCVSNKKTKSKKKKLKNAKTLSLQTFFSQTADAADYGSASVPELSAEEMLARESLLTYFSDLVRRLGPLRLDGPQLRLHLEERLSDSDSLLTSKQCFEMDNFPVFLAQSSELLIVDDYVCARPHSIKAKQLALNKVLESFKSIASISGSASVPENEVTSTAIGPPPPPPGNAWKTGPPKSAAVLTGLDPLLQLPKVESLFNGKPPTATSVPLPDLSSPPPPLPATLVTSSDPSLNSAESLSKRMHGLSMINSDLMKQLAERDRQIQSLHSKVQSIEHQLELTNLEISKNHRHSPGSEGSGSQDQLVSSLKQQLELERWNSRNLKDQLDLEKDYGSRMTEKHNFLLQKLQNLTELSSAGGSGGSGPPTVPGLDSKPPMGSSSSGFSKLNSFDSLGLRGLLANTTSDNSLVGGPVSQHKLFSNPTLSPHVNSTSDEFLEETDLFKRLSMRSNQSTFDTKPSSKF